MQSIICRTTAVAALLAVLPASPAAAQALPDPPSADRQPLGLSEPRVAPLPEARWTSEHYRLVGRFRGDGRADNQLHTLLNVPATAEGLLPLAAYLTERSTLSPRQRSLLILRAAWLGGSQPLWATGAARARDGGLTDSDLRRIAEGPEASGWDPFERTLLQLADQLYRNSSVTDAVWDALAERFSQHNMIDAVETVNHFVVLSMIYNALGVQPDDDTPDRLPADVPYRIAVPEREPPLAAARLEPLEGPGIAVSRTFARHAALAAVRSPRAGYINRVSPLTPHDREILILRIGWDCQAVYEWAKHVGTVGRARYHGVDPRAVALGPNASGAGGFEATLMQVVDELYETANVSDETWSALTAVYDTTEAISAIYTPSSYRATSMSLNAYGVQLEAGDESFPDVPLQ